MKFIRYTSFRMMKFPTQKRARNDSTVQKVEDFDKPKVMWKIIGCNINFSFDFDGMLCNNAVNIMTGNEQQLLQFVGLMNSKLFDWYLKLTTEAEVQGGGIQLYVTTLEKTLLKLDFPDQLGTLVNRRVKEEVADADIDAAIYELYGLFLEEINYIEALRNNQLSVD